MKIKKFALLSILLTFSLSAKKDYALNPIDSITLSKKTGAYNTGIYPNLFTELLGLSGCDVKTKIDNGYNQLFYGDDQNQRVYYPVDPDMAYIKDILNNDVRTEGMSYGMMISVQMNKKEEFDRLWKWTKTHMQHKNGIRKGYFAWHCRTDGTIIGSNSAADGEEWFVMALFLASARWGDGQGLLNYKAEAQSILDAMLNKNLTSDGEDVVTNLFNRDEKQIVFVPFGSAANFTDPSYHTPHFYTLWSYWADKENSFWAEAADTSRSFLRKAAHPKTGLTSDYSNFDGSPFEPFWGRGHSDFRFDAWRVAMNVGVDYMWFAKDKWQITQSNNLLNFFHSQGIGRYGNLFTLDGKPLSQDHSPGLVAMNAVAALASTNDVRKKFVEELWNTPVPSGIARYYDGLLYMLGMLQVGGQFRIYHPLQCTKK